MKKIIFFFLFLSVLFSACYNNENLSNTDNEIPEEINKDNLPTSAVIDKDQNLNYRVVDLQGFNYGYSQTEIKLKKGEPVRLIFRSTEGFHDFVVDELDIATDKVNKGQVTGITFTPKKVGSFEFYCSVGNHRSQGMVGTIIIED